MTLLLKYVYVALHVYFFAAVWVLLIFFILVENKPPTNEELSTRLFNARAGRIKVAGHFELKTICVHYT